jgi:pyruvate kinase
MDEIRALRAQVDELIGRLTADEEALAPLLRPVHPSYRQSARNLVHYVALRQHDLRKLQLGLWRQGLSSLGRVEGHVLDALEHVRARLDDMLRVPPGEGRHVAEMVAGPSWDEAEHLLHAHTRALLGPRPAHRHVSIMVTAPSAAEVDAAWVERILEAGTNVLRINGAHEDALAWTRIAQTARSVAERLGHPLRIVVDLPGPKLRTVALAEGPRVVRFRPTRDALGRTTEPCVITLHAGPARTGASALSIPAHALDAMEVGDLLTLRDARGKKRELAITARARGSATATLGDTTYVTPETDLTLRRGETVVMRFAPADVPARPHRIALARGDRFALVRPGASPPVGMPAIGCTLDAALACLAEGQRVLFDDGHLETEAETVTPTHAVLRVTYTTEGGIELGGEKGVNLPDTEIDLPLLGDDDERALAFAAEHADAVGASFVRSEADVKALHARLAELDAGRLGVIWKIETGHAFERLPAILLAALARPPVGVMIARGDLAIEAGYERLAELQEEILWLAEAAHVPVVWATQVLDLHARTGRPTRAEVTDAAMSVRAECVMLNKGPFVAEAVTALDDILRRMEQHQYKKRSLYRRLHLKLP